MNWGKKSNLMVKMLIYVVLVFFFLFNFFFLEMCRIDRKRTIFFVNVIMKLKNIHVKCDTCESSSVERWTIIAALTFICKHWSNICWRQVNFKLGIETFNFWFIWWLERIGDGKKERDQTWKNGTTVLQNIKESTILVSAD